MYNLIVILILVTIIVVCLFRKSSFETFANINDNSIAVGNPASWSGKPNGYIDINVKGNRDAIIYQGQGVPLIHEDHATIPVKSSMFYFDQYSCHPKCCEYSSYSCSNGCVCWEAPNAQQSYEQNYTISPRS